MDRQTMSETFSLLKFEVVDSQKNFRLAVMKQIWCSTERRLSADTQAVSTCRLSGR